MEDEPKKSREPKRQWTQKKPLGGRKGQAREADSDENQEEPNGQRERWGSGGGGDGESKWGSSKWQKSWKDGGDKDKDKEKDKDKDEWEGKKRRRGGGGREWSSERTEALSKCKKLSDFAGQKYKLTRKATRLLSEILEARYNSGSCTKPSEEMTKIKKHLARSDDPSSLIQEKSAEWKNCIAIEAPPDNPPDEGDRSWDQKEDGWKKKDDSAWWKGKRWQK